MFSATKGEGDTRGLKNLKKITIYNLAKKKFEKVLSQIKDV